MFRTNLAHCSKKEYKVQLGAYDQFFEIKREINALNREIEFRKEKLGTLFRYGMVKSHSD